jgi:tricorn protease
VRAVFGIRGEILTVPVGHGDIRNLTRTTGIVERDPAWSPDGKSIAYLSDESGEYALHIRDQGGSGAVSKIDLGTPPTYYYSPIWSPDSKKIAYTDKRLNFWYVDVNSKRPVRVDTERYAYPTRGLRLAWSPDSRWIAYTKQLQSHMHAIFLFSITEGKSVQLTDGISDAIDVAFDKAGQYLYFTASTDIGPQEGWLDMTGLHRPVTSRVYAIALGKTVPSPLARSDEENGDRKEAHTTDKAQSGKSAAMAIDLDGLGQRIIDLPIPARNYDGLFAGKPGAVFLSEGPTVGDSFSLVAGDPVDKVDRFDLTTLRTEQILDDVSYFDLSFDGEKMLYAKRNSSGHKHWFVAPTQLPARGAEQPDQAVELQLNKMSVYVNPRVEWKHMYEQVWRDERDFFYDPGLHGLNLEEVRKRYAPYLENLSSRDDLDYLFGEMLANLAVGHLFITGPDTAPRDLVKTGLLGADYSLEGSRYRFRHIYRGDVWNPASRSPLSEPGTNVRDGEYLLAINGREVDSSADVYSYFEGTGGQQVVLRVGSKADGGDSRDITVRTIEDETALRRYEWIENNRRKVDEWSAGRVAYIYLPDTYMGGYSNFTRYFFAQVGKDAAIIDERYNGGGKLADYVIDYLGRELMNYFHLREGQDITTPMEGIFGPKVMLINEMAGSGGDALPWMFRKAALGSLIGKRTWGGLVGAYTSPGDLLDGGFVATPDLAFYDPKGVWDVENRGVSPDIEMEEGTQADKPDHDFQLRKAVETVLEQLQSRPPAPPPRHPPYPNYH